MSAQPTVPTLIDTLALDAAISETGTFASQVSEHPVEVGSNVVDHVRPQAAEIRIDGVVTDTPATVVQARRATAALGAGDGLPGDYTGRAQAALTFLIALRENPRLVVVATKQWVYEDMAMTSLTIPNDRATGDALRFTATFRHVRTVSLRRVVIRTDPSAPRLKAKVKAGTKPTATTSAETQAKSLLGKLIDTDTVQGLRSNATIAAVRKLLTRGQ